MENQTFGDRVKELRKTKNMSMEELAKAVKTTKSSINMWENANVIPREAMLLELSKTLNASIDYLLGNEKANIWGIHNTNNERLLLEDNIIALGWDKMGDLSTVRKDKKIYYDLYNEVYPDSKKQSLAVSASTIYRFVNEAKVGDYVVYPTKFNRMVNIGQIEGEYFFNKKEVQYPHQKRVKWIKEVPRTTFSQGALFEMGSFLSFFRIKNYAEEVQAVLDESSLLIENDASIDTTAEAILESTKDYIIKKLNTNYKGYDLEVVISMLLNAIGYQTQINTHTGERDIIAYKDGFPPRNIVRVKSQEEDITKAMLQSFKDIMKEGDYGIFVTLSNFSDNAKKFLEDEQMIKALSSNEIADLILKYYDEMSEKFKEAIKLKKIFIPVIENEN